MKVLELNDAGITAYEGTRALVVSPGYITCERREVIIGAAAERRARLDPTLTENAFWQALGRDELKRPNRHARYQSDLAFMHLESLAGELGKDDLVIAVPGDVDKAQIALLLGMARRLDLKVRAVVDLAVASANRAAPGRALWHLDLHLHRAVLTELAQGPNLSRESVTASQEISLSRIRDAWAHRVASVFVRDTRFDPLHEARVEQSLYDQLGTWSQALGESAEVEVSLDHEGRHYEASLDRKELVAVAEPLFARVGALLDDRLPDTVPTRLLLGHRAAAIPGLAEFLGRRSHLEVELLAPESVARGAGQLLIQRGGGEAVPYIIRRPWFSRTELDRHDESLRSIARLAPTHLVHGGVARPLRDRMCLRHDPVDGLVLNAESPQVILESQDDQWRLEAANGAAVMVNDRATEGVATVGAGDRFRIGRAGPELLLIKVE